MGDQPSLGPFAAEDGFLRRIDRKRYIDAEGAIHPDVFKPRDDESSLSLTYQDTSLQSQTDLERYRESKRLPSGDLPGLCKLTFHDLTESLNPPRPPRPEKDPDDKEYGWLHCVIDPPKDDVHGDEMAKLATRNGVLYRYEKSKRT